ncbi:MAG: glucuronyl hydrolase [bacterium]|nr:glucuronyl hydrolase [bacterium]
MIFNIFAGNVFGQNLNPSVEKAFDHAEIRISQWLKDNTDSSQHPKESDSFGQWITKNRNDWTSGFWSGCLWYLYEKTNDPDFLKAAISWTEDLESQKLNTGDHDVGFRILCSFGNGYRLTGNERYKPIIITAANSLATRYDEKIGCIRSWSWGEWNFPVIIDNMMNLELLFRAYEYGGDRRLYDIAVSHAKHTIQNQIRNNGTTWHVIDYNPDGTVKKKDTSQGMSPESTWSRGQAWGIYGFVVAYRETKDRLFLETAIKLADYFLDNLPVDRVPYSDFDSPNIPNESKDVSAAAITCSALLELTQYVDGNYYLRSAESILYSILSDYLTIRTLYKSILYRACVRYGGKEQSFIYADYYFLEALQRYQKLIDSNN